MANGGARINLKEIVYCSQGYNSTPGSLMRLNIETLVATKIPLQIVRPFGTADPNPDFSSPNDVVLSDQYDGYFFTDPPYGYYQNFRPENTMPPAVYFADRRSLNVTRIWFFPSNYRPNGLSPSADGSRLYVANSGFQIGNGSTDPSVPIVMHVFAMSKGSKGVPVLTEMDPISTAPASVCRIRQVSQSNDAIFHEGPVFVETTNELYFSSNRFINSNGEEHIRISKLNVATPNAMPVTVITNPPILMANGGARINRNEIVYCSQGYNATSATTAKSGF
ncbi:uncharacterized protein LOC129592122 [Paramacrobiotus metropolitanus]|uniref:uncharacterized protein LOC129592122 n=1 Tax=Paramacrobiotus metropolitanus TaxID=2943436 RepID=UPI0024460D55|nr:uncharacterized protein LOC129592122 [Paramacrobiotus metropolitanus]